MSTSISLANLRKEYGEHVAIESLSAEIRDGEFFTLLGPSGCGKTTLLRMIAGFNSIEGGTISFNGEVINDRPPGERNIGMVFQNYALFPQMTAGKNVAFGLENRPVPRSEILGRVKDALGEVRMKDFVDRMPGNMSGGQQQRVALARAMVISPAVLLMDEPLSNLDAKLRVEMRETIRRVQTEIGITTVYVTHDQEEAMAVSDRIAVMHEGDIQHLGTPEQIYHRPKNLFVAEFIGKANRIHRMLRLRDGRAVLEMSDQYPLDVTGELAELPTDDIEVIVSLRPEAVNITDQGMQGTIESTMYLGPQTRYEIRLESGDVVEVAEAASYGSTRKVGEQVRLTINGRQLNLFDVKSETTLMAEGPDNGHAA